MKKTLLQVALLIVSFSPSLAQFGKNPGDSYRNPEFTNLAASHRIIAIMPFKVIPTGSDRKIDRMSEEEKAKLVARGFEIQEKIAAGVKENLGDNPPVLIQDIVITNKILAESKLDHTNIDLFTNEEICELLEVDALITGLFYSKNSNTSQPTFNGAGSIPLSIKTGTSTIRLHDARTGDMLWWYSVEISKYNSTFGDKASARIIESTITNAIKEFPYKKK